MATASKTPQPRDELAQTSNGRQEQSDSSALLEIKMATIQLECQRGLPPQQPVLDRVNFVFSDISSELCSTAMISWNLDGTIRVVPDFSEIFSQCRGFYNEKLLPFAPGFMYVVSQMKPPTSVHPFMRALPLILLSVLGFANAGILRRPAEVVDVSQVTVSGLSLSDAADSTAAAPVSVHAPQSTRGLLNYRILTDIPTDTLPSTLLPPDARFRGGFGSGEFGGFGGGF
ncbi:hypothetical protein C8J57DRAFT_1537291 [Mycena rebaudengoi]|nr:hypothetical protein C8J57DRAFT_1537291 [Mycena rebaudengoi]